MADPNTDTGDANDYLASRQMGPIPQAVDEPPSAKTKQVAQKFSPQSTDISYPAPQLSPMPALPRLQNMPQAPQENLSNPFQVFQNPMVLMAGLSSLLTRAPLTTAMNAAAGAMKGFNQGQKDVFEQQQKVFHDNLEAAMAQNNLELKKYDLLWDRKHELDWRRVYPQLRSQALANKDDIMVAALDSNNWPLVEKILVGRETAQNQTQRALDLLQIRQDIQNENLRGGDSPAAAAKNIVDGMERGDEPPTMTGLGQQLSGSVRNEASKRKFDLARAQMEWLRAQTHMRSLSGPNITKYFALADSVKNTITEVLELSQQLNLGRYPAKNRADLVWLVQTKGGTPEGDLAVRYLGAIKTLKEEFANLAQGGGVPTEPAWSLANEQINQDFGVSALDASLQEVRRLIGYRVRAIQDVANQPYNPAGQAPAAPAATAPAGGGGDGWKVERVQ